MENNAFQYKSLLKKITDGLLNKKIWQKENSNGVGTYDFNNNDHGK